MAMAHASPRREIETTVALSRTEGQINLGTHHPHPARPVQRPIQRPIQSPCPENPRSVGNAMSCHAMPAGQCWPPAGRGQLESLTPAESTGRRGPDSTLHDVLVTPPKKHFSGDSLWSTPVHPHQSVFRASTPSQVALGALPSAPKSRGVLHTRTLALSFVRPIHQMPMGSSARWAANSQSLVPPNNTPSAGPSRIMYGYGSSPTTQVATIKIQLAIFVTSDTSRLVQTPRPPPISTYLHFGRNHLSRLAVPAGWIRWICACVCRRAGFHIMPLSYGYK